MTNLEIELHTRKQEKELWVDIRISNQRETLVLIRKSDERISQLFEETFEIRESGNGSLIPYTGPLVKRRAYTLADFEPLNPGEFIKKTIRIDNAYALSEAKTSYRIRGHLLLWEREKSAAGAVTTKWHAFTWP